MAEGGFVKRDVPDTLWISCNRKDSPATKDRAKFRASFVEWMLPYKYEIVEFNFWPGTDTQTQINCFSDSQANYQNFPRISIN